jgi:hypothetical protein
MFESKRSENENEANQGLDIQHSHNPFIQENLVYTSNNPDFDPAKDVPQARGCFSTFDIISNT